MTYDPETGTVHYRTKKKKKGPDVAEAFPALDGLARLSAHIPNQWEQMVHYYGWYSNRLRGERKKTHPSPAEWVSAPSAESVSESEFKKETGSPSASVARRHWARLIQKVYDVDPLICPNGRGRMRIISFIEEPAVIERILRPLGLWHGPSRQRAPPPSSSEITLDDRVADQPASYD